jgi:hypothetical protein
LQLQPGHGYQGVLHAGMPLQQLHLGKCGLLDGEEGLAAALALLPALQHLGITGCSAINSPYLAVRSNALQGLQHLTYLQVAGCGLQDSKGLSRLPGLQELRLSDCNDLIIHSNALSGLQRLTRGVKGGVTTTAFWILLS